MKKRALEIRVAQGIDVILLSGRSMRNVSRVMGGKTSCLCRTFCRSIHTCSINQGAVGCVSHALPSLCGPGRSCNTLCTPHHPRMLSVHSRWGRGLVLAFSCIWWFAHTRVSQVTVIFAPSRKSLLPRCAGSYTRDQTVYSTYVLSHLRGRGGVWTWEGSSPRTMRTSSYWCDFCGRL